MFFGTTAIFTSIASGSRKLRERAEHIIREGRVPYTIIRPTLIYGGTQDRNMSRLIEYIRSHSIIPVFGTGEFLQHPVYVGDLATAVLQILGSSRARNRVYNLPGADALTFNDLVDIIAALLNKRVLKLHVPAMPAIITLQALYRAGVRLPIKAEQIRRLNEHKAFAYADAAEDFGYQPILFCKGIAAEIEEMGYGLKGTVTCVNRSPGR
jgi:nucleoside-diphosphate-sugar epimerase